MRAIFIIIASFFFLKSYAQGDFAEAQLDPSGRALQVYEENGKMGLKKNARKPITPAIYDTLIQVSDSRYVGKRFSTNRQNSLWGMLSSNGNVIIPFNFFTCEISGSLIVLGSAENNRIRKGVYDFDGNEIVLPKYESIKISSDHIIGRNSNVNSIFNKQGSKISQYTADSIRFLDSNFLIVYKDGKAGLETLDQANSLSAEYADLKLEEGVIYARKFPTWLMIQGYDTVTFHRSDLRAWNKHFIATAGKRSQVVSKDKAKVSQTYDAIIPVSEDFAKVRIGSKWGIIDDNGKEIIPVNYAHIMADEEFFAGRAVSNISKWSVFDLYGYLKTKLTYDSVQSMSDGRIPVKRNNRWGYLDRYGVEIISPIFEEAYPFKNEVAHVRFFGQSGLIDRNGNWVVLPFNRRILDYNAEIILTKFRDQYQVLNYQDELVYFTRNELALSYEGLEELDSAGGFLRRISWDGTILSDVFSGESVRTGGSGLTIFKANGRYGFKDQQGRIIIANRYEAVKPFHQRLAAVKIRNKWGFVDLDEILRVQPMYDSVGNFVNGSCIVLRGNQQGVINTRGKELIQPKYQVIERQSNNQYRVELNGKWGLIGLNGEVIIHPNYDQLDATEQGYFIVKRNGKYGSIKDNGISLIPLLYDFIAFDRPSKTLVIKKAHKQEWAFAMKTHLAN